MRYTVRDAAAYLDISESAVRNRLSRGTLDSERIEGVTYVVLDDVTDDIPPTDDRDELLEQLRSEIAYLREENRRKDHLLAAALERVPAIEAPEETEEPPESTEGSDSPTGERRPWWRRIFGG